MMKTGRKIRQKHDFETWTSCMVLRDTFGDPFWLMYIASGTVRWRELSPQQDRNDQGSCLIIESLAATHQAGL